MSESLPTAVARPPRRGGWIWLVPLLALAGTGWLGWKAWSDQGTEILVQFEDGHGLAAGDEIRHRGIAVGVIEEVRLARDQAGVEVVARLLPGAEDLARSGSRFWIVRPQFDLSGIGGLETVIGPRYVALYPGAGRARTRFVGLERAPVVESVHQGDLEIVLEAKSRSGLSAGAPVLYRQVEVGTVLSVGLTSDGRSVESRLHIQKAYIHLIRPETRFWNVGGLKARMALDGVSMQFDSLQTLMVGGVGLSTPLETGEVVRNGHRFELAATAEKDWLEWEPMVALGNSLLPPGAPMPRPLRAQLSWKEDRFLMLDAKHSYSGWVLLTDRGLLGPKELLHPQGDFEADTVVLEIAGQALEIPEDGFEDLGDLALLDLELSGHPRWPSRRLRSPGEPEDCIVVADPSSEPLSVAAARLTAEDDAWLIDESIAFDRSLHGASVIARRDGHLVGMLLVDEDDGASVALIFSQ